jgi:hypothetical protein
MKCWLKNIWKQRRILKVVLPDYYISIDEFPILLWDKIHSTGDMSYLLKKRTALNDEQKKELAKVFTAMYDEYIQVFGFSENFNDILAEKIKLGKLKIKKIITGDMSIQNFIEKSKNKIEAIKNRNAGTGGDIYKTKQVIEKHYGIKISLLETSVREFYSYIRDIPKK